MVPASKKERDWVAHIAALVEKLGDQSALAKALGVSQGAVSRWTSEDPKRSREPSRAVYANLYFLAYDTPHASFFWERSGLTPERARLVAADVKSDIEARRLERIEIPNTAQIPVMHDAAAAGTPRVIDPQEIDFNLVVTANKELAPHAKDLVAVRVEGDSMAPILEAGFIAIVDTAETLPERQIGRMVLARGPRSGATIKWLRKIGDDYLLIPQHTSPRHQPMLLSREEGWAIIGRVVWWIGFPPPPKGRKP